MKTDVRCKFCGADEGVFLDLKCDIDFMGLGNEGSVCGSCLKDFNID